MNSRYQPSGTQNIRLKRILSINVFKRQVEERNLCCLIAAQVGKQNFRLCSEDVANINGCASCELVDYYTVIATLPGRCLCKQNELE